MSFYTEKEKLYLISLIEKFNRIYKKKRFFFKQKKSET